MIARPYSTMGKFLPKSKVISGTLKDQFLGGIAACTKCNNVIQLHKGDEDVLEAPGADK